MNLLLLKIVHYLSYADCDEEREWFLYQLLPGTCETVTGTAAGVTEGCSTAVAVTVVLLLFIE